MTIQFHGFVRATESKGNKVKLTVTVGADVSDDGTFSLIVPAAEAKHWVAGTQVNFTIYPIQTEENVKA